MGSVRDSLADLERHRQILEQSVTRLEESLDEWRQWKREYETLRDEVKLLPPEARRKELTRTRQSFKGDLVDDKVLVEIFGKNDSGKPSQIIGVVSNRIDYVARNVETLAKQLTMAENKLAAARVVTNPEAEDEDGLPITEIVEELDDDDNVVSFDLRTAGSNQTRLLEALEKAGITEDAARDPETPTPATQKQNQTSMAVTKSPAPSAETQAQPKKKKGVTFAEDTVSGEKQPLSKTAKKVEEIMRMAEEQESVIDQPVIPVDEPDEYAQLRRDMLAYNLADPAPVVAELQIDEGPFSDDEFDTLDYSEFEEDEDEDDDEDEDQWGRSTGRVIDEEYRQKMIEIQERLMKQMSGQADALEDESSNRAGGDAGKEDDESDQDEMEGIGRIRIKAFTPIPSSMESPAQAEPTGESEAKKSVRFAEKLDISDKPASRPDTTPVKPPTKPVVDPLSDVVERSGIQDTTPAPGPTKKASRFKKERASAEPNHLFASPAATGGTFILPERPVAERPTAPSGPEGQTLATTVLERDGPLEAQEPDELDASLLQQEVAVEYNRMRNKMIQRQGGFMKEDESVIRPLDEEEGGPKRMSKFKAARLARS
ncbi:Prefoldin subunit-domain-containing protein [Pseudomassariella vexata]|uniref:Prefoldin subunit-domain-containing protein n=1 Tax=Pseudomassariella vexata TaxID=1141098 RepID=A0A1Y2DF69_9PEZI|nr:Prefoldin subunit-domain-containing protein [Pseudomassariella vexata]ORY57899.1 Prefoldin subunit-domain-containing protein [Pseudomassariella vexata]